MKKRKFNWKSLISAFLCICLVFTTLLSNSNVVKAATVDGYTREEMDREIESLNLEWSDYDWIGTYENSMIKVKKGNVVGIVYCYDQNKKTPGGSNYGNHKFRKTTVNNHTMRLLNCFVGTRGLSWWKHKEEKKEFTPELIGGRINYIVSRGYPANQNLKKELEEKYNTTFSDNDLYNGTQYAVWSVTSGNSVKSWLDALATNTKEIQVASYITGVTKESINKDYPNLASLNQYNIEPKIPVSPIPDNAQFSFFDPEDRSVNTKPDYWVAHMETFQPLLAVQYLVDDSKDHHELHVEKTWGGKIRASSNSTRS